MITRFYIAEDGGEDSGGAAVKDKTVFCCVEGCQLSTEDLYGGVEPAAVEVTAVFVFKKRPQLVYLVDLEVAGLYDRRSDGVEVVFTVFPEFVYDIREVHILV